MAEKSELSSDGMRELLQVTKKQFEYWGKALAEGTTEKIPPGDLMDYWFIMAALAEQGPPYRTLKKHAFGSIPNLSAESVRKHSSNAEKLGYIDTVYEKKVPYLQLTPAGQHAVATTLVSWLREFGRVQRKYFPDESEPDSE